MKQSTASIPILTQTFYLSEGERQLLVSSDVGEGIFFAGQNHVALRVIASDDEYKVITSNPEEILRKKEEKKQAEIKKNTSEPRTESFESYQQMRELKKQRLLNNNDFKKQNPAPQKPSWQNPDVKIGEDLLKNANKTAEEALKKDNLKFNADQELKQRDDEEAPKIKTIFGDSEEKTLKPDQHGIYSINDYKPPS